MLNRGTHLLLTASVFPSNATIQTVTFEIVDEGTTAEGAAIVNGRLQATGLGNIAVRARSTENEDIVSSVFIVAVLREPVVSVVNTNARTGMMERERVVETFNTSDFAATGWNVHGSGGLINQPSITGSFFVALQNPSSWIYRQIVLNPEDTLTISFHTRHLGVPTQSARTVWVRLSNDNGASWITASERTGIRGNWVSFETTIQGSIVEGANRNMRLAIISNASNPFVNVALDDITFAINSPVVAFAAGSSLTLTSTVLPSNATFSEVSYEIIHAATTASGVNIDGNTITAATPGMIRLRPVADGIFGEEFYIRVT